TATALHCNGWQPSAWGHQMLEADQWPHVLANVQGTVVRGTERISSNALFDVLQVDPEPGTRQRVAKRLVSAMRRAGWNGPRAMRIPGENGHSAGSNGYWRLPSRLRQPNVGVGGEVDGEVGGQVDTGLSDDLPEALEQVTRLGLRKLARVLRMPLDPRDGNLTRSQVTAAGVAINAQLRADEQRLKAKVQGDVLERLLAAIEKERKRQELGAKKDSGESVPVLGKGEDSAPSGGD